MKLESIMHTPLAKISRNGGVPIRFFLSSDMLPDAETMAQLERLAQAPGLEHYVAVLPDIHRKSRNLSPTGTVVVTRETLVPHAVDTGINCGLRMISTDIEAAELTAPVLDALFGELMRTIPVLEHEENVISKKAVADILVYGGAWSQREFGLSDDELNCIENRATMPTDTDDAQAILASVPEKAIKQGQNCLGTLGDGNHFLELQEITEVFDHETAKRLGLRAGQAFFMLHTGSRSVGSKTMKTYCEIFETKFFSSEVASDEASRSAMPIWSIPADSEEGLAYGRAVAAASNFGFANRIAITEKLRAAVRKVIHDESLQMPLLYDCAHVSIKHEPWNGEKLWVHRHGASRALPPSKFGAHPVFSKTGQPVPIPGSMGHASYVGVAEESVAATFHSVNHGAGRTLDKPEALVRFTEQQVESEMQAKNIRLYRYGSGCIAEQAPGAFKDISQVMRAMSTLSLARPVVQLRPLAVLKG
jgi:tRNA-splicing ligase RtcB